MIYIFLCSIILFVFFFFFSSRRRHTRLVSDWSSDVCSSDLTRVSRLGWFHPRPRRRNHPSLLTRVCSSSGGTGEYFECRRIHDFILCFMRKPRGCFGNATCQGFPRAW